METFIANWKKGKKYFNNNKNIPESFRILIIGSSGCGKTNLLFNMLLILAFLIMITWLYFLKP